jgi:ABC-type sugar transport system ATPase subunit
VAEFIGDPPINMLPAEVQADGSSCLERLPGNWAIPLDRAELTEGEYLVGIRPHELALTTAPALGAVGGTVRFLENLGAEHVLHVELGGTLVRVLTRPGAATTGEAVHLRPKGWQGLLFDPVSGAKVPARALGAAA